MAVVPFLAVLELDQAGPALLRPCTWASWLTKSSAVHSSCCRPCWSLCWSPLKASLKQYRFISEKNKDISEGILFFYESIFTGCFGCAIIDGAFSANSFFQNWKSAMKKGIINISETGSARIRFLCENKQPRLWRLEFFLEISFFLEKKMFSTYYITIFLKGKTHEKVLILSIAPPPGSESGS